MGPDPLLKTRRRFIKQLGCSLLAGPAFAGKMFSLGAAGALSRSSPSTPGGVVKNRAPLKPGAFCLLPLGSIQPSGWLRNQLEIQASGLSGHLDETWPDVGPNSGWLGGPGESWERGPYFLDGLIPLAWLLNDATLKAKAQKFIQWTLNHQTASGMLGPSSNDDWWPRFVMLKALTQYHELTLDPRVIPAMDRYLRYQFAMLPRRPLRDWGKFRWQDEVLSVIWLYNRTGSSYLIDLARLLQKQGHDWGAQYASFQYTDRITKEFLKLDEGTGLTDLALSTHGVNNAQAIKAGPVQFLITGTEGDRMGARKMLIELDRYHGLPNGMFSCDEHFAGRDPSQGSELCSVVEAMFSLEQAMAITGDAWLGDRLERLAFNALPGTFTDDMWAHQYNQEPNQVECSIHQKPWTTDGPESNLFGLEPNFGCCTANFHQGWPKFANSLFMFSNEGGSDRQEALAAVVYAPCEVRVRMRGIAVHVIEETAYPFRPEISMTVNPAKPIRFALQARIPGWAERAEVRINGEPQPTPRPGSFASIERLWRAGDRVEIRFPMVPRVSQWFNDSIAIERGPLVFSYGIGEKWEKLRDRGMTADWQVLSSTPWNYALDVDAGHPEESITVQESQVGDSVFTAQNPPVSMKVRARRLPEWSGEGGAADPLPLSPVSTESPQESITLIPYAAAKLRITAFAQCKAQSA